MALHKPLEPRSVPIDPTFWSWAAALPASMRLSPSPTRASKFTWSNANPPSAATWRMFDKTFPTLDCAACILTPKMTSVGSHPNITLWTYSEVAKVDGYVGNYKVTVSRKPRYVIEDLCIGCQECITACVYKEGKVHDEFNLGLSKRKPIYLPFPQAVPQKVVIDPETCIEFKSGKCKKTCVEACAERGAIDLNQKEEIEEITVGTIILATGFKTFDPRRAIRIMAMGVIRTSTPRWKSSA